MKLAQIHIPLAGVGREGASTLDLKALQEHLTNQFGGTTAALSSPATGLWKQVGERVEEDRIVVFDVILEDVDRAWWKELKSELEKKFRQREILISVLPVEVI